MKSNTNNKNNTHNTHNTNNKNNTHNTHNTNNINIENKVGEKKSEKNDGVNKDVIVIPVISVIQENSIESKIKRLLYENPNKTIKEISKKINEDENKVRTTIHRKSEIFKQADKTGKEIIYSLSPEIKEQIDFLIEQKGKEKEYEKQQEIKQESENQKKQDLIIETKNFFNSYKKDFAEDLRRNDNIINLDFKKLSEFSPELSERLIEEPEEILRILKLGLEQTGLIENSKIRIRNFEPNKLIEDLRAKEFNSLICLEVTPFSCSEPKSKACSIKFECPSCGIQIQILQEENKLREPSRCNCGRRGGFKLISKKLIDYVKLQLEDLPEKINSLNPMRLKAIAEEDLANTQNLNYYSPANQLRVIGILKQEPIFTRKGELSPSVNKVLKINSIEPFEEEINILNFPKEKIKEFEEIAKQINKKGLEIFYESFAPDIALYDIEKEALICQLGAGQNKFKRENVDDADYHKHKIRVKLHILLIGDIGTGKTILAKFSSDITPHSKYTSGSGSTSVGLIGMTKKEEEGDFTFEAGALIMAKDLCVINELNTMNDDDKPKLREALEEGKIPINKGNIHLEPRVNAGVLATANPVNDIFDTSQPLNSQLNLPKAVINRFDGIFLIRDIVNEEKDTKIVSKIIKRRRGKIKPKFSKDFFKEFFAFIRSQPEPDIDDSLENYIVQTYIKARKNKSQEDILNARFIEGLLRFAFPLAKFRLSKKIEKKDIDRAIRILKNSYYSSALQSTNLNIFTEKIK